MPKHNVNVLLACAKQGSTQAINLLWELYGNVATKATVQKSYKLNSDFSLSGLSPKMRAQALMGHSFIRFRKAILAYDATKGIPPEAYISECMVYMVRNDKRNNSIRGVHEALDADLDQILPYGNDSQHDFAVKKLSQTVEKLLAIDAKAQKYYTTALDTYGYMDHGAENEIAGRLGCSRANANILRKRVKAVLEKYNMRKKFHAALATSTTPDAAPNGFDHEQ